MARRISSTLTVSAMAVAVALGLAAAPPTGETASAARPAPFHPDGPAARQATLDATAALLDEDGDALKDALRRLNEQCRRPSRDEATPLPGPVINYSRGFHLALDRAREVAGAGDQDQAMVEFRWVLLGCRQCHATARKNGIEVNLSRR